MPGRAGDDCDGQQFARSHYRSLLAMGEVQRPGAFLDLVRRGALCLFQMIECIRQLDQSGLPVTLLQQRVVPVIVVRRRILAHVLHHGCDAISKLRVQIFQGSWCLLQNVMKESCCNRLNIITAECHGHQQSHTGRMRNEGCAALWPCLSRMGFGGEGCCTVPGGFCSIC